MNSHTLCNGNSLVNRSMLKYIKFYTGNNIVYVYLLDILFINIYVISKAKSLDSIKNVHIRNCGGVRLREECDGAVHV